MSILNVGTGTSSNILDYGSKDSDLDNFTLSTVIHLTSKDPDPPDPESPNYNLERMPFSGHITLE